MRIRVLSCHASPGLVIRYAVGMCGRFSIYATSQELADGTFCELRAGFREERRYNVAPGQWVIVVRLEKGSRIPGNAQRY